MEIAYVESPTHASQIRQFQRIIWLYITLFNKLIYIHASHPEPSTLLTYNLYFYGTNASYIQAIPWICRKQLPYRIGPSNTTAIFVCFIPNGPCKHWPNVTPFSFCNKCPKLHQKKRARRKVWIVGINQSLFLSYYCKSASPRLCPAVELRGYPITTLLYSTAGHSLGEIYQCRVIILFSSICKNVCVYPY